MARTFLWLYFLLSSLLQASANYHYPQLVVRGGLSDIQATPTPTPKLGPRQYNNGTASSSSVDPEQSPDPTPDTTTVIPVFVPPTTTISGAAETTAAKQIGPILWQVWNNRKLLEDDNTKQQYIDLVDKTKDSVDTLFNNLVDPVDPPGPCSQTSLRKRSLISGVLDALKTAADLISCADKVVSNLADEVKIPTPDLDVVDLLTDTLADIKTQLDNLDENDDDNNSDSQSQSQSSQSSSCTSSTVTDCTIDLYESTTFYVVDDSTTSDVATSTSTVCQTITACSADPITTTSIIASSTTSSASSFICDVDHCANNVCPLQTGAAVARQRRAIEAYTAEYGVKGETRLDRLRRRYMKYIGGKVKRTLPNVSNGDTYDIGVCNANGGGQLDWGYPNNPAVTQSGTWSGAGAFWMQGLEGCTGIIIASSRGFWMVHITQPGFMSQSPAQISIWNTVIDYLNNGHTRATGQAALLDATTVSPASLTGPGGILEMTCDNNVQVFTMSPGDEDDYDLDTDTDIPGAAWYGPKLTEILDNLVFNDGAPLAGAHVVDNKVYVAKGSDLSSNGRMMIEYDPDGLESSPGSPAYRVWAEDQQIGSGPSLPPASRAKRQACSLSQSASSSPSASASASDPGSISSSFSVASPPLNTAPSTPSSSLSTSSPSSSSSVSSSASSPSVTLSCSNPSLEDGDGLCTCSAWSQTITVTPDGGPGNECPQTIANFPTGSPPPPVSSWSTTAPPQPDATQFGCSNPSLEDGDGLCTCTQGTATTTVTPYGGPGNSCPTAMPPPASSLPYQPTGKDSAGNVDKCHVHVWEHLLCDNDDDTNLGAVIQIWDAVGNQILAPTDQVTINAEDGGHAFTSPLQNTLVVTGEHKGDYVQFALGSESWKSTDNDDAAQAWCKQSKWDMLSDSFWGCSCDDPDCPGVRQMDCWFACPWNP